MESVSHATYAHQACAMEIYHIEQSITQALELKIFSVAGEWPEQHARYSTQNLTDT